MKLETYVDANGNSISDRSKAKFLRITTYDDGTGDAIKTWIIRL